MAIGSEKDTRNNEKQFVINQADNPQSRKKKRFLICWLYISINKRPFFLWHHVSFSVLKQTKPSGVPENRPVTSWNVSDLPLPGCCHFSSHLSSPHCRGICTTCYWTQTDVTWHLNWTRRWQGCRKEIHSGAWHIQSQSSCAERSYHKWALYWRSQGLSRAVVGRNMGKDRKWAKCVQKMTWFFFFACHVQGFIHILIQIYNSAGRRRMGLLSEALQRWATSQKWIRTKRLPRQPPTATTLL